MAQALSSSSATITLDPCKDNQIACGAEERAPEAQACFENALGQETYQALASNRRKPTEDELQRSAICLERYGLDPTSNEGGPPPFMQNLTAQDWEVIISALLPPKELKAII